MNGKQVGVGLGAVLALAGCGGGAPSKDDAQQAFVAEFDRAFGGGAKVQEVRHFEMAGCERAKGADGYVCDIEGEVLLNIQGTPLPRPLKGRFRFSKASGVWKAYQS